MNKFMSRLLTAGSIALLVAGTIPSSRAAAQSVPLTGQIVSAGVSSGASSGSVYTTPRGPSKFVLTQFCSSPGVGLSGANFGFIAFTPSNGPTCTSFSPGYALPSSELLACGTSGSGFSCSISGVVTNGFGALR
jgi:hypothetical protein